MSKVFTISEGLENMGAIKTGGQGSVYKAKRTGEIITAVKLLPTPVLCQSGEEKHYRDFLNEVRKLERVSENPNPHVVRILSHGVTETGCFPYIEMEFIEGPDLCDRIRDEAVFPLGEALKVALQLAGALAHCHRLDVKHGDVKTNNVKYNSRTGNYVLIDFGLAMLSDEERRTSLRHAGAIEFMAPEQNEGHLYFQSDVYSYGIVLYELLAGRVPFPLNGNSETARNKVMVAHMESTPPDLLPLRYENLPADWDESKRASEMQVPAWLLAIVSRCLEKDPHARYANATELHDDLVRHSMQPLPDGEAAVASLAYLKEAEALRNILAEKEGELEQVRTQVAHQAQELEVLRGGRQDAYPLRPARGVSKGAFASLMVATTLLTLISVYSLFFHNRTAGAVTSSSLADSTYTDSSVSSRAAKDERPTASHGTAVRMKKTAPKDDDQGAAPVLESDDAADADEEAVAKTVGQAHADSLRKKAAAPESKPDLKKEEPKKEEDTTGNKPTGVD